MPTWKLNEPCQKCSAYAHRKIKERYAKYKQALDNGDKPVCSSQIEEDTFLYMHKIDKARDILLKSLGVKK